MTDIERAALWASLNKKQRIAWLRSGATLNTTSAQRQTAVARLKRKAGGA